MRPLKISMQAFGPYLETEVVDFEALGERRMFLISGDTGAGKSTILDAMCFALYGESPGDERTAAEMRSKNASPRLSTTIEFTFAVGDRRYTVSRSPAQTRAKLKGDGETTVAAKATLVQNDGPDEIAVASQPKKVTDEVIALLGFTAVQFRQVVVLPQGQFRKFLASNSDERQKILSDLFRTMRYERVEAALKDRAREVTEKLQTVHSRVEGLLAGAQVESAAALGETVDTFKVELEQSEVELQTRQTLLTSALEQFTVGKQLADTFAKREALNNRIKQIEATRDEQTQREQRLHDAERALALAADFERQQQLQLQHTSVQDSLNQASNRKAEIHKALTDAQSDLEQAKEAAPQITDALGKIERLQALKVAAEELANQTKQLDELERNATKAKTDAEAATVAARKLEAQREKLRGELTELGANTQTAEVIEHEGVAIKGVIDNHKRYAQLLGNLKRLDAELNDTRKRQEDLAGKIKDAQQTSKRLEDARDQGRATLLAHTLNTGKPCPVCGSTEHPAPADSSLDIPGEADIKNAREHIETLTAKSATTGQELGVLAGQHETQKAEAETLKSALGDHAQTPLSELEETRAQLANRYRDARNRQTRIGEIEEELQTLSDQLTQQDQTLQTLASISTDAAAASAKAHGAMESALARLPEQYRAPGAIDTEIDATTALLEKLQKTAADAQQQHQNATTARAELETELKTHTESLARLATGLAETKQDWEQKRTAAGFDSDASWTHARIDKEAVTELRSAVDQYRTELAEANGALKEADQVCSGQTLPDVVTLEKQHLEAKALWDTLNTDVTNKRLRVEQLNASRSQIDQTLAGQESLDAEFKVVQHLANIAAGGSGNPLRLSLHRYVLGVILDEVLAAATHRLLHLSRGRYRLERRLGAGDQRRAGGLELDVFDGDTGESRPVSTLSGGEGFQAALALALGLAEVTQNHAGGIHLETLFVDEGFGSLDQEALQAAISTLIEANRDGRLIGIISHVSELKEHIDTRLDIHKSVAGSSTRWVIP